MKKLSVLVPSLDYKDFLKTVVEQKQTFTISEGTFTTNFFFPKENISQMYSEKFKAPRELGLMSKVKNEIKRNLINLPPVPIDTKEIKYFDYSGVLNNDLGAGEIREFKNVVEIDLTAAYYYSALNLKLLSKETLDICLLLHKTKRLSILGAIASKKIITEYENGFETQKYIKTNKELRNAWFAICKNVDETLQRCQNICGKKFLFYYVDGVYFDRCNRTEKRIENEILNSGYFFKKTLVENFELIKADERKYLLNIYKNSDPEPKKFTIVKSQIKYIIN